MLMENYVEFKNISKAYPGVQALQNINFRVDAGEVCALLGENGAGKSTLLKILSGDQRPDEGCCCLNGEDLQFTSPVEALSKGISIIYQERQLVNELSVTENVFMEELPKNRFGIVSFSQAQKYTQELINLFGLPIRAEEKVGNLSVAHQQMVEIMKAYRRNSQVIAFDEPTAALTESEIEVLFQLILRLKEKGKIILYVSHRLKELFEICDKVVIMKDGRFIKEVSMTETTESELVTNMVGRDVGEIYENLSRNESIGEVLLEAKNLSNQYVKDVSFTLRKGEILGFAGLVGAGRTQTMQILFGAAGTESGKLYIEGKQVHIKSPKDAIKHGIGLCPEDRKEEGLVLHRSINDNITVSIFDKIAAHGILKRKKEQEISEQAVKKYNVKTPSIHKAVVELSGGNQQKVILGRWLSADIKILILDEPTKGIDVGAKMEIYQMVCDLAKKGIGIIFISSELPEVLNLCDRIIVMKEGRITGTLDIRDDMAAMPGKRNEVSESQVLSLAMSD